MMAVAVTADASFRAGSPVALFQTDRRKPVSALDSLFLGREWRRAKIPNHQEGGRNQCRAALHSSKLGLADGQIEAIPCFTVSFSNNNKVSLGKRPQACFVLSLTKVKQHV
jgi:hypothetical protein